MSVEQGLELWKTLSAVEFIRAMGDGRMRGFSEVADHIGQLVTAVEPGRVEIAWTPEPKLCNPAGTVHGGYIAMILDNAVCMAASSVAERFLPMLTLNLNVDYLRPIMSGETYTVTGVCVHPGRKRRVSTATVVDSTGRTAAQASGSVMPNESFAG
ncbi:PaaI family thioesterase [Actinomadura craniellae]|uniref:PaaI family thioesterase n=1 Tax=Actinomadura craniellae TaxID=2231787 RepID=A0A365H332_9ACTN|nr:PaaI family thioesterase [Actinomadura craniellae]RAY13507.1 PaaI family thioesterase [Actinomadura craniellae]